ncbi:MAG TPA: winged helix DNA-binding domain-containing protein [Candidatus Polarisedimenticolia bacterium]|nr:winged helix DNA-binding domain-containing protein [Candidatus Polarisedimenticolia bacterium]
MPTGVPTLTLRELNRALLARQFLLKRQKVDVVDAVERLACLQGQWAPSPYVALWSRLSGFARERLTRPIDRGEIVKATLMRATLHLASAREYPAYSLATMEGRFGAWRPSGGPALADLDKLHRAVMAFAGKIPRTRAEIQEFIADHLPPSAANDERLRNWFSWAAVATSGLVWESAGAHFEHRQLGRHIAPPAKLRKAPKPEVAYDLVVRRYLGAFGPATVVDIATWSSVRVPNIRAALARMKDLRMFSDERGRELIDLTRAPRPSAAVAAPPRFLARFDAAILGHAAPERTRILPEQYRKSVIFAAEVWPTFLVDGFVAGRWTIAVRSKDAVLELKSFKRLARADHAALVDEGEKLVRFYAPESKTHGVRG